MDNIKNISTNVFGQIAFLIAMIGGLLADSTYGEVGFFYTMIGTFIFLLWAIFDENRIRKMYSSEILPVPIVISVDDDKSTEVIFDSIIKEIEKDKKYKGLKQNLEKYFNISSDMLTFRYTGDIYEEARLLSFFQIVKYQLNEINKRIGHKVQFHIAYLRRPSFGFVVGGMFRTEGIVVYQNNDHTGGFDRVATISTRQYKEKVESYEKFSIDKSQMYKDKNDDNLLILIQISSHTISETNSSLKDFKNIIKMSSKGNGTISFDEDWVRYAQEIYNVINQNKAKYKKISIVHAMPEAVAIILGMAFENYWDIDVYQYDDSQYKKLINLQKVKYYFKGNI